MYEDALAQGRTVLIALVDDSEEEEAARRVLSESGAESVDAARDNWWLGVRDAEAERYEGNFSAVEAAFRNGFETALRGKPRGGEPGGDGSREAYGARRRRIARARDVVLDESVDEASMDSFPASDPPAFGGTTRTGGPAR